MGNDRLLHVPVAGQPGSRPLLEPRGVLYSQSFYLDLAAFWKEREKLFPKKVRQHRRRGQGLGALPGRAKLSTLLTSTGPYHRVVAVTKRKAGTSASPSRPSRPSRSSRAARAGQVRAVDGHVLRAGALLATTQFKLSLVEEKYKGVDLSPIASTRRRR